MKLKKLFIEYLLEKLPKEKVIIQPIIVTKVNKKEQLILHFPDAIPEQIKYLVKLINKDNSLDGSLIIGGKMIITKGEKKWIKKNVCTQMMVVIIVLKKKD